MRKLKLKTLDKALSETKGRFFGIATKKGEVYNAQLRSITDHYITFLDRNSFREIKVAKKNIFRLASAGEVKFFY